MRYLKKPRNTFVERTEEDEENYIFLVIFSILIPLALIALAILAIWSYRWFVREDIKKKIGLVK